jgi:hypothetical protein
MTTVTAATTVPRLSPRIPRTEADPAAQEG